MVVVVPGPAPLDTKVVDCWTTNDDILGLFVVFIGQSTTTNVTQSSSRIQSHVLSIGGLQSFPRLTINPSSTLYAAVNRLPPEEQGDETRRGLAISLLKYFTEMPKPVRQLLAEKVAASGGASTPSAKLFDDAHAANLASRMVQVENAGEIAAQVTAGMVEKGLSWVDADVVLPEGSITLIRPPPPEGRASLVPLPDMRPEIDYGKYNTLVELLGEIAFLPTSRMRRAPSKPTAVSKTRTLDKDKEEGLRREMQELVTTEQNYISKLRDLVDSIAANYARDIKERPGRKLPAGDQAMKTLFPPSLSMILALNEQFLQSIEQVASGVANGGSGNHSRPSRDPTGALGFSKTMLEYFPHFKESYQDYLRKSGEFSKILADLLRDRNSPWANALSASGEQRLKSWLIEPVQRLPRYSLFIDNMASMLPADHPAMSRFLRARDTITEICALENDEPINSIRVVQKLREIVQGWPASFEPSGRLITAIDSIQLSPPYVPDPYGRNGVPYVILLFSNRLVMLEKTGSTSARGLLAEIDGPSGATSTKPAAGLGSAEKKPFTLSCSTFLSSSRFLESNSGKLIHIEGPSTFYGVQEAVEEALYDSSEVYQLLGSYEGKAARFSEEISLAIVESRFPEQTREDDSWTLKSLPPTSEGLGIITAVFESNRLEETVSQAPQVGKVRMVVDGASRSPQGSRSPSSRLDTEVLIKIMTISEEKFSVEVLSFGRQVSIDTVAAPDFANLLVKRLSYVLRIHNRPFNGEMAHASIGLAREIILCIQPQTSSSVPCSEPAAGVVQEETRRFRPFSPVKGLSSLLGGTSAQLGSPTKPFSSLRRGNSVKAKVAGLGMASQPGSREDLSRNPADERFAVDTGQRDVRQDPVSQLEATFNAYNVALQTRRGNIVGRVVHNRANADELLVNELYNTLLETPGEYKAAAEVPVDVLFAAFEKFLNIAWREQLGPIITSTILNDMQSLLFSEVPGMVQQFKTIMSEMSRQNQSAFKSLVAVLADLVSATSNDGDRGALIMTFAEILVVDGDPIEYIMLFDRLLADADMFFGIETKSSNPNDPERARAANTGSIGSTTSSIGKKFGFFSGLSRGNSKSSDSESRMAQVLRQLSKRSNADTESTPPSISRSFLSRGRSADSRPTTPGSSPSRPGSTYSGQESPRPGSAHGLLKTLAPINEGKMGPPKPPVRKKRRSSLSDLTDLKQSDQTSTDPLLAVPGQRRPAVLQKTPSSSSMMNRGRPNFFGEVQPLAVHGRGAGRDASVDSRSPGRNTKSPTPSGTTTQYHDKPSLDVGSTPNLSPSKPKPSSPQKLRMQSPQKLRERLEREKQDIADAGPAIQAEMARIGQELSSVKVSGSQQPSRAVVDDLKAQINGLEALLRTRLDDLGRQTDSIQSDLETSLMVSEKKSKSLDELYREANAENELLYDRFNGELGKVLKAVRGGSAGDADGIQEIRKGMQEAQDEAARLRKENQRLKRENLGLRSQLRDG